MWKMGFIVSKNINEKDAMKVMDRMDRFTTPTPTLGLVIATSLDCNMACTYCYEGRENIKKINMDSAVQADMIGDVNTFPDKILSNKFFLLTLKRFSVFTR